MYKSVIFVLLIGSLALLAISSTQADDKLKELIKTPGLIELHLVEAKVPDLDSLPGQGDSDVFVRVYYNDTKELLCESRVIQDDNSPKVSVQKRKFCFI